MLQRLLATLRSSWARFSEALAGDVVVYSYTGYPVLIHSPGPVRATGVFAGRSYQPLLSAALHKGLRSLVPCSLTKVADSEAQQLDRDMDILVENERTLALDLPGTPTSNLEALPVAKSHGCCLSSNQAYNYWISFTSHDTEPGHVQEDLFTSHVV